MEITPDFLNIERIIASKNPRLPRLIPGFLIRYLKRIIHQDVLNAAIWRNRDKTGIAFAGAILKDFGIGVEVKGIDRLPRTGRQIIVSNHPLGGIDGMALINEVGQVRPDVVFPVNDLLMNVPGLQPLFIPINKHGKNTENIRIIDEAFASEKTILFFPAGLVSRKRKDGAISDLEWKKTFISKAKKFKRDIVPVYISGRNTDRFYNLANWRKRLHIKVNIEMLFLVDEMVKFRGKTITIIFGDPIPYTAFDRSKTDAKWAEEVKGVVYTLGKTEGQSF
jgi:putative hemolysin